MPDVSIVVKTTDRYSDVVKAMQQSTKAFDKDLNGMQARLNALTKTKATMKVDVTQAKRELKEAEKQFAATGDEIDRMNMEAKQVSLDEMQRNLSLVTKEAKDMERQMQKSGDSMSKFGNKANGAGGMLKSLAGAGLGQMVGNSVQGAALALVGSAGGSDAGTIASSILSQVISGAAMGSLGGPIGTAIGAGVGLVSGIITGVTAVEGNKDEAFKSYVQETTEGLMEAQGNTLTTGSSIAAQREKDQITFSTLFKSEEIAVGYLKDLVTMSNSTPFLYDDLTAMSKTLATYGYGADQILPVLTKIGDAGAALGMGTQDMNMVATALGRMNSSDKASLEYLNLLNERGINAVEILAKDKGVSVAQMYKMISGGKLSGKESAEVILAALEENFSGSMVAQSQTYAGKLSTKEGLEQELANAMGEGYNEKRLDGLQAEIDWMSGASGEAVQEANKAIGAWKAHLENEKERYIREAVDAMMASEEYATAKAAGDAAEMGRLIMQAQAKGANEYNASEGAQEMVASEIALAEAVRGDAAANQAYWDAGYRMGQQFSKGRAAGASTNMNAGLEFSTLPDGTVVYDGGIMQSPSGSWYDANGNIIENPFSAAYGIERVPYDNFPALLHEGERVQTAVEARSKTRGGGGVTISGNTFVIREDADITAVASRLLEMMELAVVRG